MMELLKLIWRKPRQDGGRHSLNKKTECTPRKAEPFPHSSRRSRLPAGMDSPEIQKLRASLKPCPNTMRLRPDRDVETSGKGAVIKRLLPAAGREPGRVRTFAGKERRLSAGITRFSSLDIQDTRHQCSSVIEKTGQSGMARMLMADVKSPLRVSAALFYSSWFLGRTGAGCE
jgi:hypothetical protein